jgi:selenocysteine lyase/cysteine desulfurase
MPQVEAFVTENSLALSAGLESMPGVELVRSFDPQRVSGIVSFRPANKNLVEIQRTLKRRGLTCTVRGDAIRLSPHFYQAGRPVLEMLDLIEHVLTLN